VLFCVACTVHLKNQFMKAFILALSIFCSFHSFAQSDSLLRPLSRYEQFINRPGTMLLKEEVPLGRLRLAELKYRKATVMADKSVAESVSLGGYESLLWTTPNTIYIDKDELDEVISTLEYFKEVIRKGKPANEPRYTYITANRVSVDCGYMSTGVIRGWQVSFAQLYKHSADTMYSLDVIFREKDIDELINMLRMGIGMQL
jgi:hypothetical protein